jgi:hypothetical protein
MSGGHRALAVFGAGEQTAPDIQHVFSAVSMVASGGEEVTLDSIWTTRPSVWVFDVQAPFRTGLLDEEKALELADIDLTRFEVADEYLNGREKLVRQAMRGMVHQVSVEAARDAMASMLRRIGGAAVLEGSLQGVSMAAGYYDDLRLVGRNIPQ